MKILVTGNRGFSGKNLFDHLNETNHEILEFDKHNDFSELTELTKSREFVVHLAVINRLENVKEFYVNVD